MSATECGSADFTKVLENTSDFRTQYLEYVLYIGEEVSRSTLLFCRPKHFRFQNPGITYFVTEKEDRFELCFHTDNYAKYVMIDAEKFDFVASDNCFDISRGEEKVISIFKTDITKDGKEYSIGTKELENLQVLTAYDIK